MAALTAVSSGLVLLFAGLLFAAPPAIAAAPFTEPLTVTMDRGLTQTNETPGVTISGHAVANLAENDLLQVRVLGPADVSQVAQADPVLPLVAGITVVAASLPDVARPSPSVLHLPLPLSSGLASAPGAFRVSVEVLSGDSLIAAGTTWMGRVAVRSAPLDLAFVWRAALGIHERPDGSFFDTALEQACDPTLGGESPTGAVPGTLPALLTLADRFPTWRFSLGVEPVLLAQLRDMAGGYSRSGAAASTQQGAASEQPVPAEPDDPAVKNAATVLAELSAIGDKESVEVATSPYGGPDLGLLAAQPGWRDGFEQIQLGKQEIVHTMALVLSPSGAWSPGLELTTAALADYGRASIDHVLVDSTVGADLAEPLPEGAVAARAHDGHGERVTLVLADSGLRPLMSDPWDPSVLFAGIAAVLASGEHDALVLSPGPDFALPSATYLDAIGQELAKDPWIRTQTMADLLSTHPPGTRPVVLRRNPAPLSGYIAETILSAVQSAHLAVANLAAAADPVSLPLEDARHALFLAQSRWWSRPGVSPEEASAGLGYALRAENVAKRELDKVALRETKQALIFGRRGEVDVVVENGADYPMSVELRLSGAGLQFPEGDVVTIKLESGGNRITVPVLGTSSSRRLSTTLIAGTTVLDQSSSSLRFVRVTDVLPWGAAAAGLILVVVLSLVFVRSRKSRRTAH